MRVLVTGGAGHVGRTAVERLIRQGWDVRVFGIETGMDNPDVEYIQGDILDYERLRDAARGCDALVHLAAIRGPQLAPAPQLFQVNVAGTFNVFEAAAAEGIGRVVQASSINAMGCAWSIYDIAPSYFPIDENHPVWTTDPYSFSKQMIEEIGAYYWRREGISSVALRLPAVYGQTLTQSERFMQRRQAGRELLDELAAQPEDERITRLAHARERTLELRRQRFLELPYDPNAPTSNMFAEDPLLYSYLFDRFNFWVYVDERDSAQAIEKSLTADFHGSHVLFINDAVNYLHYDTETLLRLFYPEVSERKSDLSGAAAPVSIERARALIGFEPEFSLPNLDMLNAK